MLSGLVEQPVTAEQGLEDMAFLECRPLIDKPSPCKGLNTRISIIHPIKGRGFMESWVDITRNYPAQEQLAMPLEKTHRVLYLKCCPADFGLPVARTRVFETCLNMPRVTWLGPDNWQQ